MLSDVDAGGVGGHLQELRAAVEALDLAVHSDAIAEARALADRLEARIAEAEAAYSHQGRAEVEGYPDVAAFLRHRCAMTVSESRRVARRAARLATWPEVGAAWREGRLRGAQVELVCATVPERHVERFGATVDDTVEILAPLTAHATGVVLRRWVGHADDAAQREAAEAGLAPRSAPPARSLSASRTLDDELVLTGHLDADSAPFVERALAAATVPDEEGERRSPTERRADALVEICRVYLETHGDLDANRRTARVTVVADVITLHRAWLRGLGVRTAADLRAVFAAHPELEAVDRGLLLDAFDGSGGVAHTLDGACVTDALLAATTTGGTLEMLLSAGPRTLSLGRSSRTFSPAQRRALLVRWGGCACCGAAPERCDAHHVRPWERGGATDLDNGVPKCRRCHLLHHREGWTDRLEPDGTYVVTRADGSVRRHRPLGHHPPLPTLAVHTTAAPADPVPLAVGPPPDTAPHPGAVRPGPAPAEPRSPWDAPEVGALVRELVLSRARDGDGHPRTERLRDQLDHRLDELEAMAGTAA